eukprot:TRINITY_DN113_c0_g1_i1.p1 TRINITY_DN113_c0_g1~~TRINITY_DN113_c0_g1_i1.p1  ORF type:complete len:311 (+),score=106.61 TRINITY_DN113_c0_g1_i1:48-980(+)
MRRGHHGHHGHGPGHTEVKKTTTVVHNNHGGNTVVKKTTVVHQAPVSQRQKHQPHHQQHHNNKPVVVKKTVVVPQQQHHHHQQQHHHHHNNQPEVIVKKTVVVPPQPVVHQQVYQQPMPVYQQPQPVYQQPIHHQNPNPVVVQKTVVVEQQPQHHNHAPIHEGSCNYKGLTETLQNGKIVKFQSDKNSQHIQVHPGGSADIQGNNSKKSRFKVVRMNGKLRMKFRNMMNTNLFLKMDHHGKVYCGHDDQDAEFEIIKHGKDGSSSVSIKSLHHGNKFIACSSHGHAETVKHSNDHCSHFHIHAANEQPFL